MESSEHAIVGLTPDGVILTWNRAAQAVPGYSDVEVIGKHVSILVPPEGLAELAYLTEDIARPFRHPI
jgi:PAS domain S-box-containing protein